MSGLWYDRVAYGSSTVDISHITEELEIQE